MPDYFMTQKTKQTQKAYTNNFGQFSFCFTNRPKTKLELIGPVRQNLTKTKICLCFISFSLPVDFQLLSFYSLKEEKEIKREDSDKPREKRSKVQRGGDKSRQTLDERRRRGFPSLHPRSYSYTDWRTTMSLEQLITMEKDITGFNIDPPTIIDAINFVGKYFY